MNKNWLQFCRKVISFRRSFWWRQKNTLCIEIFITLFSYFIWNEQRLLKFVCAGLSDFQYLLADRGPDGTYRDIHGQVYLTDLQSRSWLDEQTPLCLLPPQFSRFDHPTMYCYREPPTHHSEYEKSLPKLDPNVIGVCKFNY